MTHLGCEGSAARNSTVSDSYRSPKEYQAEMGSDATHNPEDTSSDIKVMRHMSYHGSYKSHD